MKRFVFLLALLYLAGLGVSAQEKRPFQRIESNVQIGSGLFLETGKDYRTRFQNPGIVLRLSYGLDIRFLEKWSLMPGIGIRTQMGGVLKVKKVERQKDLVDNMALADFFVTARYHLESGRQRIIFGLGPAFSYMVLLDHYHDSNFTSEKYRRFDIGIQPSVTFLHGEHFQWGMEASIGLKDLRIVYMDVNTPFSSTYLNYLAVTCGWHF